MSANVRVKLAEKTDGANIRDLYTWLVAESALRGRVNLIENMAAPDALGPVTEALDIALGSGGAAATLAGVVIAWLRLRTSDVKVRFNRGADKPELEIVAQRVKNLDVEGLRSLMTTITDALAAPPEPGGPDGTE